MSIILRKVENLIRKLLPINSYIHRKICAGSGLKLDFSLNKDSIDVLEAIFVHREYADYFPVRRNAVIVDVGAHYGYFSLFAALNAGEHARIYAVEPSPSNFTKLEQNIKANRFQNIKLLNVGLDAKSGERHLSSGASYNHSFYGNMEGGGSLIPTLSLKDFIREHQLTKVDFLKLDCEGAEYPILLEADADDLACIQTIAMEFHDVKAAGYTSLHLIEHLEKYGFKVVKLHHDTDNSFSNLNFGKMIVTKER